MALHIPQKGTQIGIRGDVNRIVNQKINPAVTRKIMVFECVFCRTAHNIEATSGNLQNAHNTISEILDAGCRKCGGRVMFKEHRHLTDDTLNGRR